MLFFNDTATTEIYTLSLHDALPICQDVLFDHVDEVVGGRLRASRDAVQAPRKRAHDPAHPGHDGEDDQRQLPVEVEQIDQDRKSTRLNSSHANISYAVFCLKKKSYS